MSETIEFEAVAELMTRYTMLDDGPPSNLSCWSQVGIPGTEDVVAGQKYRVTLERVEPELKPCPFCGGEAWMRNLAELDPCYSGWEPVCQRCGARGEECESRVDAIERWNRRAT